MNTNPTTKLYYENQYQKSCKARLIEATESALILDRTVFFPEGGGQESDHGWIRIDGKTLRISNARLIDAREIDLEGFQGGKSGGVIIHEVHPDDTRLINDLDLNSHAEAEIDINRRQKLTLSHSASHLLFVAAMDVRASLKGSTIGCHIKEDSARFDFMTHAFTPCDIRKIEDLANQMANSRTPMTVESHPCNAEARIWVFGDKRIPCGGTHLDSPEDIGKIKVKRRGIGKGKERITCTFEEAVIRTEKYHEIS